MSPSLYDTNCCVAEETQILEDKFPFLCQIGITIGNTL